MTKTKTKRRTCASVPAIEKRHIDHAGCGPTSGAGSAVRFRDAEHLWLWFMSSSKIRTGFSRRGSGGLRPCELVDVEALVTRLYLVGRISAPQLAVLKKYGDILRAPNRFNVDETSSAQLWQSAIAEIQASARRRGWVE